MSGYGSTQGATGGTTAATMSGMDEDGYGSMTSSGINKGVTSVTTTVAPAGSVPNSSNYITSSTTATRGTGYGPYSASAAYGSATSPSPTLQSSPSTSGYESGTYSTNTLGASMSNTGTGSYGSQAYGAQPVYNPYATSGTTTYSQQSGYGSQQAYGSYGAQATSPYAMQQPAYGAGYGASAQGSTMLTPSAPSASGGYYGSYGGYAQPNLQQQGYGAMPQGYQPAQSNMGGYYMPGTAMQPQPMTYPSAPAAAPMQPAQRAS
jgi:hypothetical protein